MRVRNWKTLLAGAALGFAVAKLLPHIKRAARPLIRDLLVGAYGLGEQVKTLAAQAREEVDNVVAEAKYEYEQQSEGE